VKISAISLLALVASSIAPLRADLLVQPNDRVLIACEAPLDQGMVSVDLAAYFLMCQPVDGLEVIGAPGGGVEFFKNRIPVDIAPWNPTVALISHGIDDGRVGKDDRDYTFYHPTYLGQTFDALKKIGVRTIVVGSATAVDSTLFDNAKTYNANLAAFRDEDRDLATKAGLPFVDLFGATLDTMNKAKAAFGDSYVFAQGGRDLHRNAQLVMAWAFLKALGADGNIGTITLDLSNNTATGTPGQKIVSVQAGSVNVESTRYPYCFTTSPPYAPGVDVTSDIVTVFPFNQDLNRYLLVVKGLTGKNAKVTWGTESRELAASDLAQGVNLAAAFAGHTPFNDVFNHIVDRLWQQQLKQFVWNDGTISHLDDIKKMAPGAPVDQLVAGIRAQDAKNLSDTRAMMVPIDHTIKIEPEP
jgi:hypothetical protein